MVSQDIGRLGPKEGEPVVYDWLWLWGVAGFLPWAIVLVLLLLPDNRKREAWLIFLCPAVTYVVLTPALPLLSLDTYGTTLSTLALGLSGVWLLSYRMGSWSRVRVLLLALGVMLLAGILMLVVGGTSDLPGIAYWFAYGHATLALVLAMAGAAYGCRRRYTPGRFTLWLLPSCVSASLLAALPLAVAWLVCFKIPFGFLDIAQGFLDCARPAFVQGFVLFGVLMLFVALSIYSAFFRERLRNILGIQGMLPQYLRDS